MKTNNGIGRALIPKVSARDYLREIHRKGRSELGTDTVVELVRASALIGRAVEFQPSMSKSQRQTLEFLKDVLDAEALLAEQKAPRYYTYANIAILDRYLLRDQIATTGRGWDACREVLAIVLKTWRQIEDQRLADYHANKLDKQLLGYAQTNGSGMEVAHLNERKRALLALESLTVVHTIPEARIDRSELARFESDWEYFASSMAMQVAHFTCLPQTKWHDETMFLKMIHATEACYSGIIRSLISLPSAALREDWTGASSILKEARFFSGFLVKLWAIFPTMPVENFRKGFRDATGDASAIQSRRFQIVEALTRGLSERKRDAIRENPELAWIADWEPAPIATLSGLQKRVPAKSPAGLEFHDAVERLNHDLYKWRAKHLGIARKYLGEETSGTGNEGVPYLAETLQVPPSSETVDVSPASSTTASTDRYQVTASFEIAFGDALQLAVVSASSVDPERFSEANETLETSLRQRHETRHDEIESVVDLYQNLFQGAYPVERQYRAYQRSGAVKGNAVARFLTLVELHTGVLFGIFDAGRAYTPVRFDTAGEDETYTSISRVDILCSRGEPIIRDSKDIIASITQGPDFRTRIDLSAGPQSLAVDLVVIGCGELADSTFKQAIEDGRTALELLAPDSIDIWSSR